ncbi:MAG: OmpA family protein [Methylococcales bacterium]|nr:OmpA family protein [Methylococcales bacterium]
MYPIQSIIQNPFINAEKAPIWLALTLALLGLLGCIFTAHTLVSDKLQIIRFNQSEEIPPAIQASNQYDRQEKNTAKTITAPIVEKRFSTHSTQTIAQQQHPAHQSTNAINAIVSVKQNIDIAPVECPPLFSVTFENSSTRPLAIDINDKVTALKQWLQNHPSVTIILEGYSSSTGEEETNFVLSYKRSKSVKNYLIDAGIPNKQLTTRAFGDEVSLSGERSSSKKNQRVTMRAKGFEQCYFN